MLRTPSANCSTSGHDLGTGASVLRNCICGAVPILSAGHPLARTVGAPALSCSNCGGQRSSYHEQPGASNKRRRRAMSWRVQLGETQLAPPSSGAGSLSKHGGMLKLETSQ